MDICATTPAPVDQTDLDDLARRLQSHRSRPSAAQPLGISAERLVQLVRTWQELDWRAVEAEQAAYGATITHTADGRRLHYLHVRPTADTTGATEATPLPIVLLHGWPDTPLQFRHMIPLLVAAGHEVIAPTSAGFGLSEEPTGELSPDLVAADVHGLMLALGHPRYAVHATDWGATVGATLTAAQPDAVAALHLLQPPFDRGFLVDRETATEPELAYLRHMDAWADSATHVTAHLLQADTLAAAFDDSPVGLLAWLADKYDAWSGDRIADEDIVACAATMWLTGSFRSSVRLYSEPAATWDESIDSAESDSDWGPARIEVPTAFAVFPDDIGQPPREFADRFFAVERFTVMPRGGHWAALEEPELVAQDLVEFLASR